MSKQITTMDDYQRVIALSRYSRWDQETGRRETWEETVERAITWLAGYVSKKTGDKPSTRTVNTLIAAVKAMDVMPSMRLLHFAGEAMDKNNLRLFNCTALKFNDLAAFGETVYLAMSGCGVGGRITKEQVNNLPPVPASFETDDVAFVVPDSVLGWAEAVDFHIRSLIEEGTLSAFDYTLIRPKGARLVTSGGFAPGPAPLKELIDKITEIVTAAQGRKLRTIEVHDIFTMIGSIVVAGGARRSALITLFSPNDKSMMDAKKDNWWDRHPNFAYANNSASFLGRPPMNEFFEFWSDVFKSGSGEPGFMNAQAAMDQSRRFDRPISSDALLTNPCGEIFSFETTFLCNLTNITIRPEDDIKSLKRKAGQAATLGYWQALVTDFNYLRPEWKENADTEMLLGVSMSGICDHPILRTTSHKSGEWLQELRSHVKNTADRWAVKFGTKKTVAWTTVKPSGNSGELVNASSGIHPRFSRHYVRRIQQNADDPISKFLIEQGVPHETSEYAANTLVFSFPRKAPETSLTANDMSALDQCKLWLHYKSHYAVHTISCTVYVRDHEWMEVGAWVYENFDDLIGISFLPYTDHSYKQAPYTAVTAAEYNKLMKEMPTLDWDNFAEETDTTNVTDQVECTGAACDMKF